MTLGNRIGQYRRKLGLTQDALAKQLDVTNQAVSKWESDQCCPDISLLPKIADIFGITLDALFGRTAPVSDESESAPEAAEGPGSAPEAPAEEAEPEPTAEPEKENGENNWKDTFWGNLFGKTIRDFDRHMRDFNEKIRNDRANWTEPVVQPIPDDIQLDWEDDQTLRIALFVGKKLITGHPAQNRIEFRYEGPALNIHSAVSVVCDAVSGNVWAGGDVTCDSVGGSVSAGGDVSCDAVGEYVQAGSDVSCDDVGGTVEAGGDVSCDTIHGDVKAGGDVSCDEVLGHVTAQGDVNSDEIQGNVHAGGDVSCDHLEGSITAGGTISIG